MKFVVENLGAIRDAQVELGDLTIVCGKNNTGKTYLTYSFFCFLDFIQNHILISPPDDIVNTLKETGVVSFDLCSLISQYEASCRNGNMSAFKMEVHKMLAVKAENLQNTRFRFEPDVGALKQALHEFPSNLLSLPLAGATHFLVGRKERETGQIEFKLLSIPQEMDGQQQQFQTVPSVNDVALMDGLKRFLSHIFVRCLPDAFVITCERTGSAIFRNEFLIYKDIAFNDDQGIDRFKELKERFKFTGYPLPIRKDLDFVLRYQEIIKENSAIHGENANQILRRFASLAGGDYALRDTNVVEFQPFDSDVGLTSIESSSSVRSLTEFNFYLKHKARSGQILILDEPELNLHPAAQRQFARILALLVRAGVKVFITTHSDYLLREINALIMMKGLSDDEFAAVNQGFDYVREELLDAEQVKVYVMQDGQAVSMPTDPRYGIAVESFDQTIEEYNKLLNRILRLPDENCE